MLTYKIVTPRLVIRCYEPDGTDAWLLKKSVDESIEHLKPWMPWAWNEPESIEAKAERVKSFKEEFDFNPAETELIGSCGLHTRLEHNAREIGYWVNVNHLNKGYATEIVEALVRVGFEKENLTRIEIRCDANNKVSARVPEKCGFVLKETLIANAKDVYGANRDTMIWEMTASAHSNNHREKIPVKAFDKMGKEIE